MAEEKEIQFEIATTTNEQEGLVLEGGYEKTVALVNALLAEHPVFDITNDEQKKKAKDLRATFKKCVDSVDRTRIDAIADYTATFTEQCNTIKALLEQRRVEFDTKIKAYEAEQKAVVGTQPAAKKFTATIKFTDEKIKKKLTDFCVKNGCELTIK